MKSIKVVELSVNEDSEVSVSVCNLGEYSWFNYMMMEGGLSDEVVIEEIGSKFDEWKSEGELLCDGDEDLDSLKVKFEEEVSKVVKELGNDVMMWSKFWSIECDSSLSIVISSH